jgi:hypothetical protein
MVPLVAQPVVDRADNLQPVAVAVLQWGLVPSMGQMGLVGHLLRHMRMYQGDSDLQPVQVVTAIQVEARAVLLNPRILLVQVVVAVRM